MVIDKEGGLEPVWLTLSSHTGGPFDAGYSTPSTMFTISNDPGAIHAFALALDAGLKFAALVFAALGHHPAPFAHALVVSLAAILIV